MLSNFELAIKKNKITDSLYNEFLKLPMEEVVPIVLLACELGRIKILRKLLMLNHISNNDMIMYVINSVVDIKFDGDTSVLMYACANGYISIIPKILRYYMDIDVIDKNGCTALIHAIDNNNDNAAIILLEHGAFPCFICYELADKKSNEFIKYKLIKAGCHIHIPSCYVNSDITLL